MVSLQAGQNASAADLFGKAADCYVESGKMMKAATLLTKAGQELEPVSLEDAYNMLKSACEVYMIEGKEHHSLDSFRKAITLLLRMRRLDEAVERMDSFAEVLQRHKQPSSLIRNGVSTVVIRLHQDRFQDAEAAYQRYLKTPNFLRSADSRAIIALLDALQNHSEEELQKAIKDPAFQFLEQEVDNRERESARMCVCMYVCMYVHVCVCMYVRTCVYACVYVCMDEKRPQCCETCKEGGQEWE
jgi:gamma-soluble NSF attachment protein